MWKNMQQRLAEIVAEAQSLPVLSPAIDQARQEIAQLPASANALIEVQLEIQRHVNAAKERTAQMKLLVGTRADGLEQRLQDYVRNMAADVEQLSAMVGRVAERVRGVRETIGESAGRLSAAAMHARAQLKALEAARAGLNAKARELRDRSTWTWVFLPAKAIDELVSVIQHGKSTEAALEDTLRQIADRQREASAHIRAHDISIGLSDLLKQLANSLQNANNALAFLRGHLTGEANLASLAKPETAALSLQAVMQMLQIIETEAS